MSVNQSKTAKTSSPETPAEDGLIWKDRSKTALNALVQSAADGVPIVVLTGADGSGKSTFIRKAAGGFGKGCVVRALRIVDGTAASLRSAVCAAVKIENDFVDDAGLVAAFSKELFDLDAAGKKLIILIDDADNLQDGALALLVKLGAIQRKKRYLLRIILAGKPALFDRVQASSADSEDTLAENIAVPALTRDTSFELIKAEALRISDGNIAIEDAACATIYRETNGVPGPTKSVTARIVKAASSKKIEKIGMRNVRELLASASDIDPAKLTAAAAKARAPSPNSAATSSRAPSSPNPTPTPPSSKPVADVVGAPDQLPKSIRESEDPQQLLRWAMGIRNKPNDPAAPATPAAKAPPANTPPAAKAPQPTPRTAPPSTPSNPAQAASSRPKLAPLPDQVFRGTQGEQATPKSNVAPLPTASRTNAAIGANEQFLFKSDEPIAAERGYKNAGNPAEPETLVRELAQAEPEAEKSRWRGAALFLGGLALGGGAVAALLSLGGTGETAPTQDAATIERPADPNAIAQNSLDASATDFGNHPGLRQGTLRGVPSDLPPTSIPALVNKAPSPVPGFIGENQSVVASTIDASAQSASQLLSRQNESVQAEIEATRREIQSANAELTAAQVARTRIDLETTQSKSELALARQNADNARARLEELNEEVNARRTELSRLLQDLATGQLSAANVAADTDTRAAAASERLESLMTETRETESNLNDARSLLDTITSDIDTARAALGTLEDTISEREIALAEQATRVATAEAQKIEIDRTLANTVADLEAAQSELASRQDAINAAGEQLAALQTEQNIARDAIADIEAQAAGASEEFQAAGTELQDLQTAIRSFKSDLAAMQDERQALAQEISTLEGERADLAAQNANLQEQTTTLGAQQSNLLAEASTAQAQKEELSAEIASLQSSITELQAQQIEAEAALANLPTDVEDRVQRATLIREQIEAGAEDLATQAILRAELNIEIEEILQRSLAAQQSLGTTQERIQERRAQLASLNREIETAIENAPQGTLAALPALRGTSQSEAQSDENQTAALDPPSTSASEAAQKALADPLTGFVPRDSVLVETALARTPGLTRLDSGQMAELQDRITGGECLTDALLGVTGTINRHTLAVLLRSLSLCTNQ